MPASQRSSRVPHFFHHQLFSILLISAYIGSRIRTASCCVNCQFSLLTGPEVMHRVCLERVVQDLLSQVSMETRDWYLTPSLSRCI